MRIHMIGIGGAGMSGIAEILHHAGHTVTGSDLKESPYTRRLAEIGVEVYTGHAPEQVGEAEEVVVSTAIPQTNLELREARRLSVPVIPRAAALARILEMERSVAVTGTHGKTTTTSMIAHALKDLGEEPTALIGGELNDIGSNVVEGATDLIVAEADESDKSLLYLRPQAAVITNVEFDHPDFYASLDEILATFTEFVRFLPPSGHLVVCADDAYCLQIAEHAPCTVTTYGLYSGTLQAEMESQSSYKFYEDGVFRGRVELAVSGRHNVLNSLAVAATARWLGCDAYEAARSLHDFSGVRRRFQIKGEHDDIRVIDDYAHHPTEISATLEVARATLSPGGRLITAFQPHRYSRTRSLYREFAEALFNADVVVLTDVYGAGELPQPGIDGKLIVEALAELPGHPEIYYLPELRSVPEVLGKVAAGEDTVITLGAGDISTTGDELLKLLPA